MASTVMLDQKDNMCDAWWPALSSLVTCAWKASKNTGVFIAVYAITRLGGFVGEGM